MADGGRRRTEGGARRAEGGRQKAYTGLPLNLRMVAPTHRAKKRRAERQRLECGEPLPLLTMGPGTAPGATCDPSRASSLLIKRDRTTKVKG